MDKRRFNPAAVGFIVLIVLVVGGLMSGSLRRTVHVELPDPSKDSAGAVGSTQYGEEGVSRVEIAPETVQAAVATLQRPETYTQVLAIERSGGGDKAVSQVMVSVNGQQIRVDTVGADGQVRHAVTDSRMTAVWYDNERSYFLGTAGDITGDQEQSIPTYENLLELDASCIAAADFREFSGENCIYAETVPDEFGVVERYWVSVSTGLLTGAERLADGETFYRMAAQQSSTDQIPAETVFRLPDGTYLSDH